MKDILDRTERWLAEGKKVALATVIATERSSPRDPGTAMAVTDGLEVAGSVSGGCVEAAVVEEATEVIRTGRPRRVAYGISDDEAFAVGLSCGGVVHIFVESLGAAGDTFVSLARAIRQGAPVALLTEVAGRHLGAKMLVSPDGTLGGLDDPALDAAVVADARAMLERGQTGVHRYGAGDEQERRDVESRDAPNLPRGRAGLDDPRVELHDCARRSPRADTAAVEVFINSFAPPPRMYIFGATTHAAAAAAIGKFLGYQVTVCDARGALATRERIPDADEIVVQWPDEFLGRAPVDRRTVICVLTHDPKFDVPLLKTALTTPAGYIGILGSRRTHEARCRTLRAAGVSEETLGRIHAPIGLDLGARTPQEVAVAIAAEIVSLQHGARPLNARPQ